MRRQRFDDDRGRESIGRRQRRTRALVLDDDQRATMVQYARTTQDDLRWRRLLDSDMDVYQWFLMISRHAQRHILRIREIKEHSACPRR